MLCQLPLAAQRPERYLEESFAYPDGGLRDASSAAWTRLQGDPPIAVVNREAVLGPFAAEATGYLTRRFTRGPSSPVVEAMVAIRVDAAVPGEEIVATGETFLQFAGRDGKARRGRVAVRSTATGHAFRLGVASKTSSRVRWAAAELPVGQVHLVRLVYDSATGRTWLWVNPTALDEAPHAESVEADTTAVDRLSLQVGPGLGNARVRISRAVVQRGEIPTGTAAPAPAAPAPVVAVPVVAPVVVAPTVAGTLRPAVTPPAREALWIFVLAGQSNMAGRGVVETIDTTPDPRLLVWQRDGTWALATEPLHDDKPRVAGVGPGLAFARALLKQVPEGVSIGLVPVAFGGTRIGWWHRDYVGSQRWAQGPTYYQHLLAATRAAVGQGDLKGILWNQGESDAGAARADGGAAYREQLFGLIRDLRADLGVPELPFVAATLGPWRADTSTEINDVFLSLPTEVPTTATVNTLEHAETLRAKVGDPSHYDSPSARKLGELYAEAMAPLLGLE